MTAGGNPWRRADWDTPRRDVFGVEHVAALTATEAASLDRSAREEREIPERVLMESAGRAAALILHRAFPRGRVLVLAGSGHNGGDALIVARTLHSWGRDVAWIAAGSQPPPAALTHGHALRQLTVEELADGRADVDVLVDGLLGTGAAGAPRGAVLTAIQAINASRRPVLALDIPSGIDPTTGEVPGESVRAALTVSFGQPKIGTLHEPARSCCGRLIAVEIGLPPLTQAQPEAVLITPEWVRRRLPVRAPDAHKNSVGQVLIVAGREGVAGAAALTGLGALRAGAGFVRIASPAANRTILQAALPEAVFVDRHDETALGEAAAAAAAIVAGPGIGTDAAAGVALRTLDEAAPDRPLVLDADALNVIGRDTDHFSRLAARRAVVLTPHPGEMSRIVGAAAREIAQRLPRFARDLAEATGCVVLLKGQPSVVAGREPPVLINTCGSSDVASAGMGDLLSGVIGALLAQRLAAPQAAAVGVFLSSRAGDLARRGPSLTPRDVADQLHRAWSDPGRRKPPFDLPFILFDQARRW
ncbi:MAG: NAD(P)H-hydrate dehydratase [Longimicrobiales bacterium]